MNSKQRVQSSLGRKNPDRVPIWMWFHPQTTEKMAMLLEIPVSEVSTVFQDDIRQMWVGNNFAMEGIVHEHNGDTHKDQWGIEWIKEGPFNQVKKYPLEHSSDEQIMQYRFPYECINDLLKSMLPIIKHRDDFFIGCDVSPCLFEFICRLRNMENAILDFLTNPNMMDFLLEESCRFSVMLSQEALKRFSPDWLWTGDDVAGQQSMIMDPQLWREMIKPRLKRIFDIGKSKGLWIAYHSCGAVRAIIPDLIEIGLDVLNPVQCNCPGMDPLELKKEYGQHLSFMGGIDTQHLLPNGSVKEIRNYTEKLIEGMMVGGGGYILAASHTIPPETPTENIFALYQSAGITKEMIFDNAAQIRKKIK